MSGYEHLADEDLVKEANRVQAELIKAITGRAPSGGETISSLRCRLSALCEAIRSRCEP